MRTYPKIDTLFDRNQETFKVKPGVFRRPEFEAIDRWFVTEKIDGTNIRLHFMRDAYDGIVGSHIGGRTDKAQFETGFYETLLGIVDSVQPEVEKIMEEHDLSTYTLFGEGYGARIQKGGGNYRQDQGFILFDVLVNDKSWLNPYAVQSTAGRLGIRAVPVIDTAFGTEDIVTLVSQGYASDAAEVFNSTFLAEGVVAVPRVPFYTARGDRVIWKLKTKDF